LILRHPRSWIISIFLHTTPPPFSQPPEWVQNVFFDSYIKRQNQNLTVSMVDWEHVKQKRESRWGNFSIGNFTIFFQYHSKTSLLKMWFFLCLFFSKKGKRSTDTCKVQRKK
jgi:hypothetical protein